MSKGTAGVERIHTGVSESPEAARREMGHSFPG